MLQVLKIIFFNYQNKKKKQEKSLILIDEVDILFDEYDKDFTTKVKTLMTNSKIPIILTSNTYDTYKLYKSVLACHIQYKRPRLLNKIYDDNDDENGSEGEGFIIYLYFILLHEIGLQQTDLNPYILLQMMKIIHYDIRHALYILQFWYNYNNLLTNNNDTIHEIDQSKPNKLDKPYKHEFLSRLLGYNIYDLKGYINMFQAKQDNLNLYLNSCINTIIQGYNNDYMLTHMNLIPYLVSISTNCY